MALTSSAIYNMGFQFAFRIFTFVLNGFLLRIISRDLLGVANVRLMLIYTTLSFLVREPFRRAGVKRLENAESEGELSQKSRSSAKQWSQFVNVLWFCPVISIPVTLSLCSVWIFLLVPPNPEVVYYYTESVVIYGVSIIIESLAEPLWILGQQLRFVRLKVFVECVQVFTRSILVGIILVSFPHWNLMAFSIAMLISSSIYALIFFGYFLNYTPKKLVKPGLRSFSDLLPKCSQGIDKEVWALVRSFWSHSLVKQLLTEGERYVMTFFNVLNFSDQGVYDVIHNLGSLVARFLFAPLEESAYNYFSLTLYRDRPATQQDPEKFPIATKVLCALLKLTVLVGLIICSFGSAYSYLALHLYGGSVLSSGIGPALLRWYCVYVVMLGLNGITECFAFAAMRKEQVDRHQSFLFIFCVGFLGSAVFLTKHFGSVGFIWANCLSMVLRIIYSVIFISKFYQDISSVRPVVEMIPKIQILVALLVDVVFTMLSNVIFCCDGVFNMCAHIAVGALCLFATVMTIHSNDHDLVNFVDVFIIRRKLKEK